MPIQSINPANGDVLRTFTPLTAEALQRKIAIAHAAFGQYAEVPLAHRALCMRKLATLLETETAELAALITAEMGKPITQSRSEILKCASVCRYYADHAARILAPEPVDIGANDAYVRWDPLGVILAVMPWNFPFWQVFRFLAPALMAGNVGLLKHASNVPQCALAIEALVRRAGFPRGTFQTLLVEASQVEMLIADDRVAAVTLTGSESAGRAIAAQAGWLIKKTVLELGGSDPFIIMPSADLTLAVAAAVRARCINNGQSCIAAKRFLVADSIYDDFEKRFVTGMDALKIGDPTRDDTDIGPLATPAQVEDVHAQVQAAVNAGGRALTGGERVAGKGNYYEPTVLAGVPRTAQRSTAKRFSGPSPCCSACAISMKLSLSPTTHSSAWAPLCGRAMNPSSAASPRDSSAAPSSSTRSWQAIPVCRLVASRTPATGANSRQPVCANSSTPRRSSLPSRLPRNNPRR